MPIFLHFAKFHALGNDFVILDRLRESFFLDASTIKALSNRHTGIGFDQLLILEPPLDGGHDFSYQVYNANGSAAMQCFNGLRALAHYAIDMNYSRKKKLRFQIRDQSIDVDFISSSLTKISFEINSPLGFQEILSVDGKSFYHINVGNPHLIQWVDDIKVSRTPYLKELKTRGYDLNTWNISFAQYLSPDEVALETFERGVGRTLCCGSAAVALLLASQQTPMTLNQQLKIRVALGYLTVQSSENIYSLIGPITRVFQGQFAVTYE